MRAGCRWLLNMKSMFKQAAASTQSTHASTTGSRQVKTACIVGSMSLLGGRAALPAVVAMPPLLASMRQPLAATATAQRRSVAAEARKSKGAAVMEQAYDAEQIQVCGAGEGSRCCLG